jgi:pyruvate formate lyase activating enzyme
MSDAMTCQLIEISRGTTHDGPGMRTTVFLKGCPLKCLWCQNPEGMKAGQDIWWEQRKCIHCLSCVQACLEVAIFDQEDGLRVDRERCTLCGACVEACPSMAMAYTGQEWTLAALLKEVLKDRDYYQAFGGGVTVSGGEPMCQFRFVAEFFKQLRQLGVHTAIDTCGLAPAESMAAVLPYTNHVLFDIKLIDSALHRRYTAHPNETILQNLQVIAQHIRRVNAGATDPQSHMKLWIRTPLIPDATATNENIEAISRFIHHNLPDVVERWELCAFNSASKSKYQKMGLTWAYEDHALMSQHLVESIKETALSAGIQAEKLVVSGLITRE